MLLNWDTLTPMVVKKIAVTEQSEEAPANETPAPDEHDTKDESLSDEAPTDAPEPGPHESSETEDRPELQPLGQPVRKSGLPRRLSFFIRNRLKRIKLQRRALVLLGGVIIIGIAIGTVLLIKSANSSNPLPEAVKHKVKFTLYYPRSGTGKYKYLPGSSGYASGKLTYNLGANGRLIHVSEQALSVNPPDLHALKNFSVFKAPAGEAAVGANGNVLNGVLIANKTLIILNGLGDVSMQDFIQVINDMQP